MKPTIFVLAFALSSSAVAQKNESIASFSKAKRFAHKVVYAKNRKTLYCNASFDEKKKIAPLAGFKSPKYKKRAKRVEWEHVVPAENFGRSFIEWREGHPKCVDKKGKSFKGRICAGKMNREYQYMQADMYNLFPAIGAVNAMRSNYNFVASLSSAHIFGSCKMFISNKKASPPESARGRIARTYLYMDDAYPKYRISKKQRQLFRAWDKLYPVSKWECKRALSIERIQGNINTIMKERCL